MIILNQLINLTLVRFAHLTALITMNEHEILKTLDEANSRIKFLESCIKTIESCLRSREGVGISYYTGWDDEDSIENEEIEKILKG